jgi:hypothetical protein
MHVFMQFNNDIILLNFNISSWCNIYCLNHLIYKPICLRHDATCVDKTIYLLTKKKLFVLHKCYSYCAHSSKRQNLIFLNYHTKYFHYSFSSFYFVYFRKFYSPKMYTFLTFLYLNDLKCFKTSPHYPVCSCCV